MVNFEELNNYANEISADLIKIRQKIHQNPELGLECFNTAKLALDFLKDMGFNVKERVVTSGLEAVLKGGKDKPVVALRADMDALPIKEETGLSFTSNNEGVMHACGHDGHVAIVLGAAKILNKFRNRVPGTIKLILQPGEEYPGAAEKMIEEGVLKNPVVDALISGHIFPGIKTGKIGIREGAVTARNDEIVIKLVGEGGHGAHPDKTQDPIVASSLLILELQTIISRIVNPISPLVVNIGEISGGGGHNVIPKEILLKGTIRSIDKGSRDKVIARIEKFLEGISVSYDMDFDFELIPGEPVLYNDKKLINICKQEFQNEFGLDKIEEIDSPSLGSEDCAYFSEHVPTVYFRFGSYDEEKGYINELHTPKFNFDESLLSFYSSVMAYTSLILLKHFNRED